MAGPVQSELEQRLKRSVRGTVRFDPGTRARYATDASAYQVVPSGVVIPRDADDVAAAMAIARAAGVPVTARGGGTSQCGQTVNTGIVLDCSVHMNRILSIDPATRRAVVQPGVVLDELNRHLRPHGLWFPVDVSTASRATIGGMAGNNSCGSRSLRYGNMRENTVAIDAILADGSVAHFGPGAPGSALAADLLALGAREAEEIAVRFPAVQRRVGGYNIDALVPRNAPANFAHLLVGSEGTLGFSTAIELALAPLAPRHKMVGACHFATFRRAMEAAAPIVALGPVGVELVDRTMLELAGDIAMFRATLDGFVQGRPEAILLVEFAEDSADENLRRLARLAELMADLGNGPVTRISNPAQQAAVNDLRTAGLNIMMSMKEEGKPVSFVEDAAVPLEHLADYTERLTEVFERHGTRGTWYAHAGSGCLHVRPVLNLKLDRDLAAMRAIAEEAFAMVREYKGSHSGEHGDGIVRSEFHRPMFGDRIVTAFETVKDRFDPAALLNPGRIVRPPRMDDRALLRYGPEYKAATHKPVLDWSAFPRATPAAAFQGAVEMCNNNGACRALAGGVMCPSYRATRDEADVTRGRANTLRLALSGQLGPEGLASDTVAEAMSLCVSCKACRRECPTGVDMARMKIEVLAARAATRGIGLRERLVAHLPRLAPHARRLRLLLGLRDSIPALARLSERLVGFSAARPLPRFDADPFRDDEARDAAPTAILFADTFNRWFEPANLRDATRVMRAAGAKVAAAHDATRPLCCGRTYLASGLVEQARAEAQRSLAVLAPLARQGLPIVGLEPSCLLTMRDEWLAMGLGEDATIVAKNALLFEEWVVRNADALKPVLRPVAAREALVHGHCHSKAFAAFPAILSALRTIPGLTVTPIESSCCGMAGSFGYQAETAEVSRAMAELSLLPAVRAARPDTLVVANGTSCRHQIGDLGARTALTPARVLAMALDG